jgi:hypothetical protein
VLNSGHTKSQAYVLRCVGDDLIPQQFSTWCPKVFAHIGRVHPTLEDRSVCIVLRRKLKTEKVERIPKDNPYVDLRRKCARWAADNLEALADAKPEVPGELNDRAADNWEPLLAIAEACRRGKDARDAARALSGTDDDETDAIVLLADLKAIFASERQGDPTCETMTSSSIAAKLAQMEDRKWPDFRAGKPITPQDLATLLKPFGIRPRAVSSNEHRRGQAKGYRFAQFKWTFERYLGADGHAPATPA